MQDWYRNAIDYYKIIVAKKPYIKNFTYKKCL
jgi:hypothetical protein